MLDFRETWPVWLYFFLMSVLCAVLFHVFFANPSEGLKIFQLAAQSIENLQSAWVRAQGWFHKFI